MHRHRVVGPLGAVLEHVTQSVAFEARTSRPTLTWRTTSEAAIILTWRMTFACSPGTPMNQHVVIFCPAPSLRTLTTSSNPGSAPSFHMFLAMSLTGCRKR